MSYKSMTHNNQSLQTTKLMSGRLLQRKCACGQHTPSASKCSACAEQDKFKQRLQTKLEVGATNDSYEQEADRVAEQVVRMSESSAYQAPASLQTKPLVQRRASNGSGAGVAVPGIVNQTLGSGGRPLNQATRAYMEPRFGHDFGQVRIHDDSRAAASAAAVSAKAYTVGRDVVFGAGQYAPATAAGKQLLAHELTHVVQQGGDVPTPRLQRAFEWGRAGIGALIGGAGGALVGGLIGGPIGALIGAGVGAVAGGLIGGLTGSESTPAGAVDRKQVTVQPVAVANDDGTAPTAVPSFSEAQSIWGKCCVNLRINSTQTVNRTAFKELDAPLACTPQREASALATAAAVSGNVISVFVPDTFRNGAAVGKDVAGGGFATDASTSNPKVFIVSGAHGTVMAHELGHAMGHASCLGRSGHSPSNTVMVPSGAHNTPIANTSVAPIICTNVRGFSGASSGGPNNCTQDFS